MEVEQGQERPRKPEAARASCSGVLSTVLPSAPAAPGLPGEGRAQAEARWEAAGKAGERRPKGRGRPRPPPAGGAAGRAAAGSTLQTGSTGLYWQCYGRGRAASEPACTAQLSFEQKWSPLGLQTKVGTFLQKDEENPSPPVALGLETRTECVPGQLQPHSSHRNPCPNSSNSHTQHLRHHVCPVTFGHQGLQCPLCLPTPGIS